MTPFVTEDGFDRTFLELAGGLDVISPKGMVVRANRFWKGSHDLQNYGGNVKLSFPIY